MGFIGLSEDAKYGDDLMPRIEDLDAMALTLKRVWLICSAVRDG